MDKFNKIYYEFKARKFKGISNAIKTYYTIRNTPVIVSSNIVHTVLEVSSICNLKCKFCEYSYWDHKGNNLKYETFKKIFSQLPYLYKVNIGGIGEPLINPDIYKMIRYMKKKNVGNIILITNGTLLNKEKCKELILSGVSQIYVSLAAATNKTYDKIRPGDKSFNKIKENIHLLVDQRNKFKKDVQIYINAVLIKDNIKELPLLVKLCHSLGVDYLNTQEVVTFGKGLATKKQLLYNLSDNEIDDIFSEAKKIAKELGFKLHLPSMEDGKLKKKRKDVMENTKSTCIRCFPWYSCYITYDVKIVPCCWGLQRLQRDDMVMGDATKNTMKEIWNNDNYKNLRSILRLGRVPKICTDCRWLKQE